MGSAVDYRSHANQVRVVAEGLKEGTKRDRLLRIAAGWERMATDSEEMTLSHHLAQHLPWPTD